MSMNGNGPRKRPPPAQQRDTIKPWLDGKQPTLKIADVYYVISTKWLKQWKAYVSFDEETTTPAAADEGGGGDAAAEGAGEQPRKPPNSIDNSVLLKDPGFKSKGNEPVIKTKAIEGVDFILIPQKPWAYLYKWYGGGPELAREVIGDGKEGRALKVEVFPLALTFKNTNTEGQINPFSAIEVVVSKKATVGYLKSLVCRKMELDSAHTRVWNYVKNTGKLIKEENVTLEEAKLVDGQSLLIEVRLDDGSWPRDGIKKRKSSGSVKDKLADGRRGSTQMLSSTLSNMKALLGTPSSSIIFILLHSSFFRDSSSLCGGSMQALRTSTSRRNTSRAATGQWAAPAAVAGAAAATAGRAATSRPGPAPPRACAASSTSGTRVS